MSQFNMCVVRRGSFEVLYETCVEAENTQAAEVLALSEYAMESDQSLEQAEDEAFVKEGTRDQVEEETRAGACEAMDCGREYYLEVD